MAYEVFKKGKNTNTTRGSRLTINCGKKKIMLSKAATARINGASQVRLFWDRQSRRFALTVVADNGNGEDCYKLFRNEAGSQSQIGCSSFLINTGLSGAGVFDATWDEENKRLEWSAKGKLP